MTAIHTIKNSDFKVEVKETGAELCSFRSLKSGREYIWQADPSHWAAHAPNLFPIIGCLKEDAFLYKGKAYPCLKHGFFRKNPKVKLLVQSEDKLTYVLKHDEETLAMYPFQFEIQVSFILRGNSLEVHHLVQNPNKDEMLFSLGGHPAFACPVNQGETYSDYYLEFEKEETAESWSVTAEGLIDKGTYLVFKDPKRIHLQPNTFEKDALVFKDLNSKKISLKSKKSQQVLSVEFSDFPYMGIWAKPGADFVCIEPWLGIADSVEHDRNFETKEGLLKLAAGNKFEASYTIRIDE